MFKKFIRYLNPIDRLGKTNYSIVFPLLFTLATCILSEFFSNIILKNPNAVGSYLIFVNIATIIYFSFRDGLRGGAVTIFIVIFYYLYIIYTRNYSGNQLIIALETTALLTFLYFLTATIIGWLKQTIDKLIVREADEKRRLQEIIAQLPVGVVITDNEGYVEMTNSQLETILGDKTQIGLQTSKSNEPLFESLNQSLATGRHIKDQELKITRDNKTAFLNISSSGIRNSQGKIFAGAIIISDITPQKEMESRKDDFFNMASHELKTPITSIGLYIDIIMAALKDSPDERIYKMIKCLRNQTQRLQNLVNDMLDISRLQTGKLRLDKEEFRLDSLIKESIDTLHQVSKKREMKFEVEKPTNVTADKFRIYQVITNLITNAIKYSDEDTQINVKLKKNLDEVIVSVEDRGIGIEQSEQKKIFNRLYQIQNPEGNYFSGLGMGLYISKEILKRHRGKIWVESEKGKGSTFFFSLPLKS